MITTLQRKKKKRETYLTATITTREKKNTHTKHPCREQERKGTAYPYYIRNKDMNLDRPCRKQGQKGQDQSRREHGWDWAISCLLETGAGRDQTIPAMKRNRRGPYNPCREPTKRARPPLQEIVTEKDQTTLTKGTERDQLTVAGKGT